MSEDDEETRKLALREIRIHKLLKHQNILTLYEVYRKNNSLFLIFEDSGKTLASLIQEGPLDLDLAKRLVYQLVSVLKYIHSFNVIFSQFVHGSLSPQSLIIFPNSLLKVSSLGKVCEFGVHDHLSQCSKLEKVVPSIDVWAVGCIFCEILIGQPLFSSQFDEKILAESAGIFNWLDQDTLDFLTLCLNKNSSLRPSCEDLLVHPIFKFPLEHRGNLQKKVFKVIKLNRRPSYIPSLRIGESLEPICHNQFSSRRRKIVSSPYIKSPLPRAVSRKKISRKRRKCSPNS